MYPDGLTHLPFTDSLNEDDARIPARRQLMNCNNVVDPKFHSKSILSKNGENAIHLGKLKGPDINSIKVQLKFSRVKRSIGGVQQLVLCRKQRLTLTD